MIQVTIQGSGAFNLEFAASLGNGPLGPYQPVPFNAPATARAADRLLPSPVPWTDPVGRGSAPARGMYGDFRTTFTRPGSRRDVDRFTAVIDDDQRPALRANIAIPAAWRPSVRDQLYQLSASPRQQTIRRTVQGHGRQRTRRVFPRAGSGSAAATVSRVRSADGRVRRSRPFRLGNGALRDSAPQVLVEEVDRPLPGKLRGRLVVARRRVVVEAVLGAGIDEPS